jgi:ATP-dependent DNA ligase
MLCELSRSLHDCFRRFAPGSDLAIEVKMDGERVVVHWDRDDEAAMRLFSRKGNDMDALFGYGPVLLPHLRRAVDRRVRRAIFDGEVVPWDSDSGQSIFGHSRAIAKETGRPDGSGRTLRLMLFDVLLCEGDLGMAGDPRRAQEPKLTGLPLDARRRVLEHVIKQTPFECELVPQVVIPHDRTVADKCEGIAAEMDKVIAAGGEGLVVKNRSAPYTHDARDATLWTKLKPEQMAGLAETLDVLVLGGYNAVSAGRSGGVDGFLVGVRAPPDPGEDPRNPQKFYTLGKVGTGFSRQDTEAWREKLRDLGRPWPKTKKEGAPPHLCGWWPSKIDDRPDVWYPPDKSFLLELKCAQLVSSEVWKAGKTFRFPVVVGERRDKHWYECNDQAHMLLLASARPAGHMSRDKDFRRDQVAALKPKAKTAGLGRLRVNETSLLFQQLRVVKGALKAGWPEVFVDDTVPVHSSKRKLTVYVLDFRLAEPLSFPALLKHDDPPCAIASSRDVAELVVSCGGKINAVESAACQLWVAPPPSAAADDVIRAYAAHDLMTIEYVLACIRAGKLVPPLFEHYANVSATRREAHKGEYDEFGEHFFEPATQRSLAAAMAEASRASKASTRDPAALADLLLEERDPLLTKQSPLRGALLYVDQFHGLVADDGDGDGSDHDGDQDDVREAARRQRQQQARKPREGYKYSMIETATLLAQQAGAHIARVIAPSVTHIVLDKDHADYAGRKNEAHEIVRRVYRRESIAGRNAPMPLVVSYAWLLAVTDSGKPWETVRLDS